MRKVRIMRIGLTCAFIVGVLLLVSSVRKLSSTETAQHLRISAPAGQHCIPLTDERGWSVFIRRPGHYCLMQNLYQSWPSRIFSLAHQPVPQSPLISIENSNVVIDLNGHDLSVTQPMGSGIYINQGSFMDEKKMPPYHTMKIYNGRISTSQQATVFMVHAWNRKNKRFYSKQLGQGIVAEAAALADYGGDISQYGTTEYILENLTLKSVGHAIIMQGKKNIIRNCKIIGSNGTVNLYGPNLIFENNEIILEAREQKNANDEPPVALYLEDAANSVVRNNRIIIKGRATNVDAIVLKNSTNVQLDHNIIRGASQVYKLLDKQSSVVATTNTIK